MRFWRRSKQYISNLKTRERERDKEKERDRECLRERQTCRQTDRDVGGRGKRERCWWRRLSERGKPGTKKKKSTRDYHFWTDELFTILDLFTQVENNDLIHDLLKEIKMCKVIRIIYSSFSSAPPPPPPSPPHLYPPSKDPLFSKEKKQRQNHRDWNTIMSADA